MPLGSIQAPPQGCHGKKHKKIFSSETTRPRAFMFFMLQCAVVLFINLANHAPDYKNGPAQGSLAPIDIQWEIFLSKASLRSGKGCTRFWDRSDQNSGFHGN